MLTWQHQAIQTNSYQESMLLCENIILTNTQEIKQVFLFKT